MYKPFFLWLSSRERSHIPPWERENHCQLFLGMGYGTVPRRVCTPIKVTVNTPLKKLVVWRWTCSFAGLFSGASCKFWAVIIIDSLRLCKVWDVNKGFVWYNSWISTCFTWTSSSGSRIFWTWKPLFSGSVLNFGGCTLSKEKLGGFK